MVLAFEPKFTIGQSVCLTINSDIELIIDQIGIIEVDDVGQVTNYIYSMFDGVGRAYSYREQYLSELVEQH